MILTGCRQPGRGHSPLNRSSSRRSATPNKASSMRCCVKSPSPQARTSRKNGFKLRQPFLVLVRPVFNQELGGGQVFSLHGMGEQAHPPEGQAGKGVGYFDGRFVKLLGAAVVGLPDVQPPGFQGLGHLVAEAGHAFRVRSPGFGFAEGAIAAPLLPAAFQELGEGAVHVEGTAALGAGFDQPALFPLPQDAAEWQAFSDLAVLEGKGELHEGRAGRRLGRVASISLISSSSSFMGTPPVGLCQPMIGRRGDRISQGSDNPTMVYFVYFVYNVLAFGQGG